MNRGIMKGIISLGLLCLFFVCSVNSTGSIAKNHLHSVSRALEQCTVECKSAPDNNPDSKNWLLEIDVGIYIVYNKDANYFGIYNAKLQIVILFELIENSRLMILVNIKTGAAILINIDTKLALFINGSGAIDFTTDIYGGFEIVFKIIVDNRVKVQGHHDIKSGFYFDITIIFSGNLDVAFEGRKELRDAIKLQFNAYFIIIQKLIKRQVVGLGLGIAILFSAAIGFTDESSEFTRGIYALIVFTVTYRHITAPFMDTLFKVIIQGKVEVILRLVQSITAIGGYYKDLAEALKGFANGVIINVRKITKLIKGLLITITSYSIGNSWFIFIGNSSEKVMIIYNAEFNIFAIYNQKLNLFFVLLGKFSKSIIFSTSNGAGLFLDWSIATGFAVTYLKPSNEFALFFKNQITIDLSAVLVYLDKNAEHFKAKLIPDFNLLLFINGIKKNTLSTLFVFNPNVLAELKVGFSGFISSVKNGSNIVIINQFYFVTVIVGPSVEFIGSSIEFIVQMLVQSFKCKFVDSVMTVIYNQFLYGLDDIDNIINGSVKLFHRFIGLFKLDKIYSPFDFFKILGVKGSVSIDVSVTKNIGSSFAGCISFA